MTEDEKDGPRVSRIALGCMGLAGTWNPSEVGPEHVKRAIEAFEAALSVGITFYDHADIYGGGACESVFKDCLAAFPGVRETIFIATKCGIRPGHYNLTADYISQAVDRSLARLGVDYIDLYQAHRPDPLTHPAETARALSELVRSGKVRYIGVSNYYPEQIRALRQYLDLPIRSNQISISLRRLDPIYEGAAGNGDGVLDQCMALHMTPLAYSPLGGGWLTGRREVKDDPLLDGVLAELRSQGEKHGATVAQMALAWLLAHPAGIIPLVGSANPNHILEAAGADAIELGREDWYRIWVAARGKNVP
jgi:predicted oxidoreductase